MVWLGSLSSIKTESSAQVLGNTLTTWSRSSTYSMAAGDAERGLQPSSEQSPLLGARASSGDGLDSERSKPEGKTTTIIWTALAGVFVIGLILVFTLPVNDWDDLFPSPKKILKSAPVIDGHIGWFIPHVSGPQHLGLLRVYPHACNQTYPNSFGCTMRTTCLRSTSMSQRSGMLIYRG